MSYKVEELLALRDSVSESAVSIEKFADEDVIKEHVLRPSASATLAAAASNRSLRSSATAALAPAAPDKKPSPSPSIKRGKAERLLKEHGSPPGMRVTAGGRIVPSDLPPVLNNRFVNTAFKPPALRGVPGVGNNMSAQSRADAGNVPRLEVVGNQPVLYVGDRAYALPALDTTASVAPSLASGVLDAAAKSAGPASGLSARSSFNGAPLAQPRLTTPTPFAGLDIAALKAQQTLRKQELRTVEQTEVLQASHQTDEWRAGVIEKKRNLIIELDALRKQISALEAPDNNNNNVPPTRTNGFPSSLGPTPTAGAPPSFVPQFQQPMTSPVYGFQGGASYPPMMMYPSPFSGYPNIPPTEPVPFVQNAAQAPQSPGSASRRSHAIQIKPPPEENKKQATSALDPKSPTYEPMSKNTNAKNVVPPTPSPAKPSSWRTGEVSQSDRRVDRELSQKPSLSSIDTTDFFPTNTHEHSSTRVAPTFPESKPLDKETTEVPSTPEKNWPASPWNEGNSSRSSHKAGRKQLTAWPEAFGKEPSSGLLRQTAAAQQSTTVPDRFSLPSGEPFKPALSNSTATRKTTDQRFGTEETWPPLHSKRTSHVPSTYQEGFQAGYDHVGVPDSPDVLKGYVQGLLQFLSDEHKKGLNNPLRGLVASSQPASSRTHDSAVSMMFNRVDAPVGSQENVRSLKINTAVDPRMGSAFDPPYTAPVYTLCNETAQEPRMRNLPPAMYMSPTGASDRALPAYQQAPFSATENDIGKRSSDKGAITMSREEATTLNNMHRQFSGNQLTNRPYGPPASMQRYGQTPQEYSSKGFNGDTSSFARTMANQRLSGLDGAMDDLADLALDTNINEQRHQQVSKPPSTVGGHRSTDVARSSDSAEGDASCFRPSSSKGKQKLIPSPVKSAAGEGGDVAAPSPANSPESPKKSGEHSPAKAKLEQVTNKFKRSKKDEARNTSPEHNKKERTKKWRTRFRNLREDEARSVSEYNKNTYAPGERP